MRRGDRLLEARAAAGDDEARVGRLRERAERQTEEYSKRCSHAASLGTQLIAAVSPRITAVTCAAGAETCVARRAPRVLGVAPVNPTKDFFMKQLVVLTALAVLAG